MKKNKIKFSFAPDFQLEILRFIIQDKEGGLVLSRIKPSYLVLIEHSLICEGILKYFKKQRKIPSQNVLKQVLREMLESKTMLTWLLRTISQTLRRLSKTFIQFNYPIQNTLKRKSISSLLMLK